MASPAQTDTTTQQACHCSTNNPTPVFDNWRMLEIQQGSLDSCHCRYAGFNRAISLLAKGLQPYETPYEQRPHRRHCSTSALNPSAKPHAVANTSLDTSTTATFSCGLLWLVSWKRSRRLDWNLYCTFAVSDSIWLPNPLFLLYR